MNVTRAVTTRFWNLRLAWKLLVPLVVMTLVVGLLGTFVTVRHLTGKAEIDLERDLFRRSAAAQATVRDIRLELADTVNFGANIQGVPEAVARADADAVRQLLASVAAVHTGLDLLVATGIDAVGLVEVSRRADGLEIGTGTRWDEPGLGEDVIARAGSTAPIRTGFLRVGDIWMLATGGPVILDGRVVGTLIAGVAAQDVAHSATEKSGAPVEMFDRSDRLVAGPDRRVLDEPLPQVGLGTNVRRMESLDGKRTAVLYGPLDLGSQSVGTLGVRLAAGPAFEAARGTTIRLVALVLLAMAGIVGLGILFTRVILRQVRPLVEANRALGRGDFTARARVRGTDELGELARGLNLMAEQLQASQAELEMQATARTEELERLYRAGLQQERGRADLFAEIAHEFRNHLFTIGGYADLMAEPNQPSEAGWLAEYGRAIGGAAAEMTTRIDEILDLARADAGKMSFEMEAISFGPFVEGLRGTIVALARRGEIVADVDVPDELLPVRADRRRLVQIVLNLVSNAVKYTPPGGRIRVEARAVGGRVALVVNDTGIGIPEEAGDRIFEPFYRASSTTVREGFASSGLGLAVTKRLVEGHGGRIEYRSEPGKGTIFTVTLPGAGGRRVRAGVKRARHSKPTTPGSVPVPTR